jgi:protein-serine/threonine kinase
MNDKNERHSGLAHSSPLNLDIARFISEIQNETADEIPPDAQMATGINIRANASSAALAALFNASSSQPTDKTMNMGLEALISILQEDKLSNDTSPTMLAKNLHDLSLSTAESKTVDRESQLRTQLLHALATPFYEPIVQTPIISLNKGASSLALSSLGEAGRTPTKNDRVFHNVSQRNTSPQAVFTCELDDPWNLKAANDLACLIFGVSRTSLRRLTLLDLIAADARDFVLNRLIANSITNKDIIFAGEVVAIAKRGNKVTWASLWAKKKGNLIICMFDQVPCDSVDLVFSVDSHKLELSKPISGNFFNHLSHYKTVDDLVQKFSGVTDKVKNQNSSIPLAILEAQVVNDQRYFTVKKNGFNIPCAITSKVLDENEGRVKLRIHSMPYIAGVFIVSASTHKVLSLNDSIGKNLFGYDEKELTNEPVDKVIPNFTNIMTFVRMNMPALKIVPGLVLPEHFFRQINAITENKGEDGFLTSFGIDGCHKDGSIIKIDVQLRCSDGNTLVLWVTHSRTVYGSRLRTKVGFEDISADSDNEKNVIVTPSRSENGDSEMEHPSQLSIFNENEVQSISRSSSLRSSPAQSSTASTTEHSEVDINSMAPSTPDNDGMDLTKYKVLDQKLDELTLLKIENDAIERTKNTSKHYPRVIGSKRREKSIKEFDVIKKMGQGAYGRVILAKNKEDPNYKVVIKLIIKERILVDTWVRDRKLGTIPSEIQIMSTLNNNPHPNIMRLIDFFEDDDYYYIELPPHGFPTPAIDLFDLIELKKNMTESECKSIIKQCISAINHLHNNGVVHRDIKDENLIIDTNGVIKLIDFGSASYIKQGPFDVFVGTLDYAAPEVLNGQSYEGKPQDVWSLGILLYTLVYKENPFYNVDEIMEGELRIPFVTSEGCLALIKRILQRDIRKRPTMQEIFQDEWLNS